MLCLPEGYSTGDAIRAVQETAEIALPKGYGYDTWNKTNLMKRIAIGIVLGVVLALVFPKATGIGLLGEFFVGGLRAIAPLLVFALVANALSQHQKGTETNMKKVIVLYLLGTFAAAFVAVLVNYIFPITITLTGKAAEGSSPTGLAK